MIDDRYLWTKADGTQVDVRVMKYGHLRNALRLLYRASIAKEAIFLASMPDFDDAPTDEPTPSQLILRHYPQKSRVLLEEWARREIDRPETDYRPDAWAKDDPKLGPLLGSLLEIALRHP